MKRPLFVFAGQSNMMGAAVYPVSEQIEFSNSFEYLHKAKRLGKPIGDFKTYGFPSGEFSYKDMKLAYGDNDDPSVKSTLDTYTNNTHFCPSMCNLADDEQKKTNPFDFYSEQSAGMGVCMVPYIVKGIEDAGYECAYAHIAKGGVFIDYYTEGDACEYFHLKSADFFADSAIRFPDDDTSERILVWHQGESNAAFGPEEYKKSLAALWQRSKETGFTKMLIVRVGYWGDDGVFGIMKAQEEFCNENDDVFMITRVGSFLPWGSKTAEAWLDDIKDEYLECRDSFHGFANEHINEKGFKLISSHAIPNIIKVVYEGKEPILEEEKVIPLM